jgi:hypothetical protein
LLDVRAGERLTTLIRSVDCAALMHGSHFNMFGSVPLMRSPVVVLKARIQNESPACGLNGGTRGTVTI